MLLHAEQKGVTLVLEHLNSRDSSHPMKGHPGYFGDDVDFCVELIKKVGSPNFKLLFDIYHVSIMNGDIIRRLRQHREYLGHIHTAGNPRRGELDNLQEIHYPNLGVMLQKMGYAGFVGHESYPRAMPRRAFARRFRCARIFEQFFMVSSGIVHNILWESAFEWAGYVAR